MGEKKKVKRKESEPQSFGSRGFREYCNMRTNLLLLLSCSIRVFGDDGYLSDVLQIHISDDACASLTTPSDDYWDAVTSCGPCVRKGCGFCLSTLQCVGGDAEGPRPGGLPCPNWLWKDDTSCPVIPECGTLNSCGECATHEMCAWCGNDDKCMTVEETFYKDCRGVVFDAPCPSTFTPG